MVIILIGILSVIAVVIIMALFASAKGEDKLRDNAL